MSKLIHGFRWYNGARVFRIICEYPSKNVPARRFITYTFCSFKKK